MNWSGFATAAPELADAARVRFDEQHLCLVGTIRADGWPRISPNEVYFVDGELLLGMMRASRKSIDIERDPRISVITPQCSREAVGGDTKLYGRAVEVTDPLLRSRYGDAIFAAIGWRPDEPYPLYALDIHSAGFISFGDDARLLRWTPATGVEVLRHPDA